MGDEYELVSHQELELLKSELKRLREQGIRPEFSLPSLPDDAAVTNLAVNMSTDVVRSFNSSLLRLNMAFERQLQFLERAQKEMANAPSDADRFSRIEAQNEKIAAGVVSMANMVRDQQIQINQLSMLLKGMHGKIEEVRLQRRSAFRIPPISDLPRKESQFQTRMREQPVEIEIPNPINDQILAEEKQETYPSISMLNTQGALPEQLNIPEDIPLPPKKNLLSRFVKS